MDIKQLLAAARLPERTVAVCLRGDLLADHERLVVEYANAKIQAGDSLAGGGGLQKLLDEIEALRDQMREHEVMFRFRAVPRRRWNELEKEHPARDGNDDDGKWGFDRDAVTTVAMREGLVDPVLDDDDWQVLDAKLTEAQYTQLGNAVWLLNMDGVSVPFSLAALLTTRTSDDG